MEPRAAKRRGFGNNTTERVDLESDEKESSDELELARFQDGENPTNDDRKRHLRSARRTETPKQIDAPDAKRCKTMKNGHTADNASVRSAEIEAKRIEIARAMREARRLETPEQTAKRRAKANECQKRRREQLQAIRRTLTLNSNATETSSSLGIWEDNVIWSNKQEKKRLEKLRQLQEARKMETPAQGAERRAKAAECQRKRRERLRAAMKLETPEETAARVAKEAELAKRITPQQAAARRAKRAEYERKRRQREALKAGKQIKSKKPQLGTETPEQVAALRKRATELQRNRRAQLRAERETSEQTVARRVKKTTETNEQAAARRAKAAAYERQRRQRKTLKRLQDRAKATEREKIRRKVRAEAETPEQAAARRQKAAESQRMRRDLLRDEMPERIAALRAKAAAYERQRRQRKALTSFRDRPNAAESARRRTNALAIYETPEQAAARRAKAAEGQKRRREELKAAGETVDQTAARHAREDGKRKRKEMWLARCEADTLNSTMSAEDDFNRLERLRQMREARKRETSEETAARRAKANECQRRRRNELRAAREAETPEQTAARLAKESETPQQAAERRAKKAEYERRRRQQKSFKLLQDRALSETPEETATRRAKAAGREKKRRHDNALAYANAIERQRQKRKLLNETETPEQAAARRAKAADNQRKRREQRRIANDADALALNLLHVNLTPAEKERRRRELRAATETPEQAAERRAKAAEKEKQRRQRKAFACLQDSSLAFESKIKRMERLQEARKKETPEQAAARREKAALGQRRRREQFRAAREAAFYCWQSSATRERKGRSQTHSQKGSAETLSENTASLQNDIDEDLNSSSTKSAFERAEGSSSIISIGDQLTVQQTLEETSTAMSEFEEDPWLCFDDSELSFVSADIFGEKEVFESLKDVSQELGSKSDNKQIDGDKQKTTETNLDWFSKLLQENIGRDEHIVYCEYIAERFRKCNRSITEIKVAKDIIESIMLNLSTGAYRSLSSAFPNGVAHEEEAPTLRPDIIPPIVQAIIVKEEVQL